MTFFACDTCRVIYVAPPDDGRCRIAFGGWPSTANHPAIPRTCDGEVVRLEDLPEPDPTPTPSLTEDVAR